MGKGRDPNEGICGAGAHLERCPLHKGFEAFAQEGRIAFVDLFEPFTGSRSIREGLGGDRLGRLDTGHCLHSSQGAVGG